MKTNTASGAVAEPLSPEWIYDTLMEKIEPELMIANLKHLDAQYADETPDERKNRYERYDLAFFILNECLKDMALDATYEVENLKNAMMEMASSKSDRADAAELTRVEQQINSDSAV